MRTRMILNYNFKHYIGWANDATSDAPACSYSAWIYSAEEGGERVGRVTWPTIDGWEDHKCDSETNACAVEDCSGICEDESNACDWSDENATFHPAEFLDVTEEEMLKRLEEI